MNPLSDHPGPERAGDAGPAHDLSSLPVAPSVTPLVAEPIGCLTCGYDLRGLLVSGLCPECGASIRSSIAPALLRDAPGGYAAELRGAVETVLWAIGLFVFGMLSAGVAVFAGRDVANTLFGCSAGISVCVGLVLWAGGWAVMLRPGPPVLRLRSSQRRYRVMGYLIPVVPSLGVVAALVLPGRSAALVVAGLVFASLLSLPLLAMLGIRQIYDLSAYVQRAGVRECCAAAKVVTLGLSVSMLAVVFLAVGSFFGAFIALLFLPLVLVAFFGFLARLLVSFRRALDIEIAVGKGPAGSPDSAA